MIIDKLTLCNFLSTGNCTQIVHLNVSPLTLILGENIDSGSGIDKNGAGKTTILQAISYALYGEPLTKITLDNLCNRYNVKEMLVTIEFERDGISYRIERGRKPNILRWFINDEHINHAQGENKQTQIEIDRIIGMSHTMFCHIVALNTYTIPFLREKTSEQREIIEELLGIMQLSSRAESLKQLIDFTKESIRDQEASIKANNEANARIQKAIDGAMIDADEWQISHDTHLMKLKDNAEKLFEIDFDAEIAKFDEIDRQTQSRREIEVQIQSMTQQITTTNLEITRRHQDLLRYETEAKTSDMAQIRRLEQQAEHYLQQAELDNPSSLERLAVEAERHRRSADEMSIEVERLALEVIRIQDDLANPAGHKCPTCAQGLAGTQHANEVINSLTSQAEQITNRIETMLIEIDESRNYAIGIDVDIVQLRTKHEQYQQECLTKSLSIQQEIASVIQDNENKRTLAVAKIHDMQNTIDQLKNQSTEYGNSLSQAQTMLDASELPISVYANRNAIWQLQQDRDRLLTQIQSEIDKLNPHTTKAFDLGAALTLIDYEPLNQLTLNIKHETFLYKLLTAKDSFIRKRIVDQNLRYLNKRLDHYIIKLGLPHEVRFLPDLSVEISLLGCDFDFEQLSRGEMNRLILSTAFAFRDTWESLNMSLNLIFVDEFLDNGLDDAGVDAAWTELQDMGRSGHKNIFVVSHKASLLGRADRTLLVRKEANFTNLHTEA